MIVRAAVAALAVLILPVTAQASAVSTAENASVIVRATMHAVALEPNSDGAIDESTAWDKPICSGWIARSSGTSQLIVTAKHCTADFVDQGSAISVKMTFAQFFDGDVGRVTAVYQSPSYDLALLSVTSMRKHSSAVIGGPLARGEAAFVLGQPDGMSWAYSPAVSMQGQVRADGDDQFFGSMLLDCPSCYVGDSGAGVFNLSGHVVGVLVSGNGHASFMVPATDVVRAIESYRGAK